MTTMGEYFRDVNEIYKQRRAERSDKFIPLLKKVGAIEKSDGVWMIGDYLCYPTKGFAMHKRTYKKKGLQKHLNEIFKDGFTPAETDKCITSSESEGSLCDRS